MKKTIVLLFFGLLFLNAKGQTNSDSLLVHRAALEYLEGFYEGDTLKLQRCLSPELHKYGYYKDQTGLYEGDKMSYTDAIAFAKNVLEKKRFAKPDAPKQVNVIEVQEKIACVKVVAWWGMDYLLLAKHGENWRIEQVIWQGPLKTVRR
ncbi:MAG TPA: nuclear transport factor 2 family protein [Saprospiraceae bacterium]|nr:nuclear transport factor 2 family protein [Saprospiraceae bacterium]HMQ83153.1 nuclear transport factor 2 family protein [Saprospiraceae bacterium]